MSRPALGGVYVAALTPLKPDFKPDLEAIPPLLEFYARRGVHGALLLGTTAEGPSFAPRERTAILRAALAVRESFPDFRLLAGTGTPSLEETADLTRAAFDLGYDGVVVLPPYYFRKASEEGLFAWFSAVIRQAVPSDGAFFGYHIPQVSGVAFSLDLLARLKDAFPAQFVGIKDSSGSPEHARALGARFRDELTVLTGNDRMLSLALENHASGCITAMANLVSPVLRQVWQAHQEGETSPDLQERLNAWRSVLDEYQPMAPTLKALLARHFDFPLWPVRPPLLPLPSERAEEALSRLQAVAPLP